jgi:hypothetical protein
MPGVRVIVFDVVFLALVALSVSMSIEAARNVITEISYIPLTYTSKNEARWRSILKAPKALNDSFIQHAVPTTKVVGNFFLDQCELQSVSFFVVKNSAFFFAGIRN